MYPYMIVRVYTIRVGIYIYMCVCVYIYTYIEREIYIYTYRYIYIYAHLDRKSFFRFDRLVQAVTPPTPLHHTTREFVDNQNLAVLDLEHSRGRENVSL